MNVWSVEVEVLPTPSVDTTAKWYVVEVARPFNVTKCDVTNDALLDAKP